MDAAVAGLASEVGDAGQRASPGGALGGPARSAQPARIVALDGLRGLAALAVLSFHLTGLSWPAHGHLAVDLFFMLSGFVLASVYEERFRAGLSIGAFLALRLARLWPLFAFGLTCGAIASLGVPGLRPATIAWTWAASLTFVGLPDAPGHATFVLDPPMWSLALEMLVGLAFAAGLWKLPTRAMAALTAVSGSLLAVAIIHTGGGDFGPLDPGSLGPGLLRVFFGFPMGWLLWRLRRRLAGRWTAFGALAAVLGVSAAFAIPAGDGAATAIAVFAVFPLSVAALAFGPSPKGALAGLAALAGAVSYPLYATQAVTLWLSMRFRLTLPEAAALALAAAWLAHRTVEADGRRLIAAALAPARRRAPVASA